MKSQHNYLYGPKPYMLLAYDQIVDHRYLNYLKSVSSIDVKIRSQIQSAIHWYGRAISEDEPTISYVAAWTGLECIGPVIDNLAHPEGTRVQCDICRNTAGEKRRKYKAGITHIFNRITCGPYSSSLPKEALAMLETELLNGFSSEDAQELRNAIVHGLGNIESLTQRCAEAKRHLIHALTASIQLVLGPSVKLWATGDFEFHPVERASIKCIESVSKSPYHGEWFEGLEFQARSIIPRRGELLSSIFKMEWQLDGRLIEMLCREGFKRDTNVFAPDGSEILDFKKWRDRPLEPPWQTVSAFLKQEGSGNGAVQSQGTIEASAAPVRD